MASLPNILTIARMAALVPIVFLLIDGGPGARWAALAIFCVAAATDALDGWLARRLNIQSTLGRILDPIADKVLVCGVIIVLTATSDVPVIAALVIVIRELFVCGLREALATSSLAVGVTPLSKAKTVLQCVAIVLVLIPDPALATAGLVAMWLAALVTALSGLLHGEAARRALTERRRSLSEEA
ncbi:MAG: CDP-diacylglycerol--glycerol-3-phosphate 3-phosphatidyltransferase [bacterium]|nr:CDP-diacylglycerol--glycerol-3-phosphate 3-phosphatidyltransferase [bacterium]